MEIIITVLILGGFSWISLKMLIEGFRFRNKGILVDGQVQKVEEFDDDGTMYKLKIKFQTQDGQSILGVCEKSSNHYNQGTKVCILYDYENPNKFLVDDPQAEDKIGLGLLFLLGDIIMVFSLIHYVSTKSQSGED